MGKERAPEGKIRVAHPSHFVCAIFKPPLEKTEREHINIEEMSPPPVWNGIFKISGERAEFIVWHKNNFGMNKSDRWTSFEEHVESALVEPLAETRIYKSKPMSLGEKAIDIFKERETRFHSENLRVIPVPPHQKGK